MIKRKLTLHFFTRLPAHERKITLSTLLTFARVLLTPCIVYAMLISWWGVAFGLFLVAAVTDLLDGFLARLRNERTFLGAALDPIADKFLILSCFFTLSFVHTPLFVVPTGFVWLVLAKELIIILGAIVIYCMRGDVEIKPTKLGKLTTVVQICFIIWLFACYFFAWMPIKTYYTMLGLVITVVMLSLAQYVAIGMRQFLAPK